MFVALCTLILFIFVRLSPRAFLSFFLVSQTAVSRSRKMHFSIGLFYLLGGNGLVTLALMGLNIIF